MVGQPVCVIFSDVRRRRAVRRALLLTGIAGLVLLGVGCAGSARPSTTASVPTVAAEGGVTNSVPEIRPLDASVGHVVRVHAALRFAVIDYSLNVQPAPGDRLAVYREGRRVGGLKAGHFRRDSTVAADFLWGEVAEGDEVRSEIVD